LPADAWLLHLLSLFCYFDAAPEAADLHASAGPCLIAIASTAMQVVQANGQAAADAERLSEAVFQQLAAGRQLDLASILASAAAGAAAAQPTPLPALPAPAAAVGATVAAAAACDDGGDTTWVRGSAAGAPLRSLTNVQQTASRLTAKPGAAAMGAQQEPAAPPSVGV